MQLEEFVKRTLLDITNGVAAAQDQALLYVAPGFVENERQTEPQFVRFEVAVTVNQDAGGGINVWSFADAKAHLSSEKTNRIAFDVPVYFQAPTSLNPKHYSKKN